MVEISEIDGRDKLRDWLYELPFGVKETQRIGVAIAQRASLRILPVFWCSVVVKTHMTKMSLPLFPVLRANFLSGIAGNRPTLLIERAANAFVVDMGASFAAFAAARTAAFAAAHARRAVAFAADAAAFASTEARATSNDSSFWQEIQSDCRAFTQPGVLLDETPLWSGPNPFEKNWQEIRAALPPDWAFWRDWYQDALDGKKPNWDMLEEIALIDPEDWDKGADHMNGLIAQIQLKYTVAATPNAEDIILNDDGLFEAVPRSQLPAKTLNDVQDRLRDVVADIRRAQQQENNQYNPLVAEADLLENVLARYPKNALRLHEACLKVVIHVNRNVASGVLPENDNLVGDVGGDVQNSADDIYSFDAEVRETVDARAALRFERLSDDEKAEVARLAEAAAQSSVDKLAEELREDVAVVQGEGVPDDETTPDRYRLGSRLAKMLLNFGKNVGEALILVGGVGGGIAAMIWLVRLLLGL